MVVRSRENTQVAGSEDSGAPLRSSVSDGSGVTGDSRLLDIVASLSTDKETIVTEDGIDVGSWALEEVEESATVEVWLLEVQVNLGPLGLGAWEEGTDGLSLETLGD